MFFAEFEKGTVETNLEKSGILDNRCAPHLVVRAEESVIKKLSEIALEDKLCWPEIVHYLREDVWRLRLFFRSDNKYGAKNFLDKALSSLGKLVRGELPKGDGLYVKKFNGFIYSHFPVVVLED